MDTAISYNNYKKQENFFSRNYIFYNFQITNNSKNDHSAYNRILLEEIVKETWVKVGGYS
jgi:hypothetical protein